MYIKKQKLLHNLCRRNTIYHLFFHFPVLYFLQDRLPGYTLRNYAYVRLVISHGYDGYMPVSAFLCVVVSAYYPLLWCYAILPVPILLCAMRPCSSLPRYVFRYRGKRRARISSGIHPITPSKQTGLILVTRIF